MADGLGKIWLRTDCIVENIMEICFDLDGSTNSTHKSVKFHGKG